jgi:hypothetical protein
MTEPITTKEYMLSLMILNLLGLIKTTEKSQSIEMLSKYTHKELLEICQGNIDQYEMVQEIQENIAYTPKYTESH